MFRRLQISLGGVRVQFSLGWLLLVIALAGVTVSVLFPSNASGAERWSWLFAAAIVALGSLLALAVHELGHVLAAQSGINRVTVVAPAIAGALLDTQYEPESPRQEVRVALAGPLASILASLVAGGIWWVLASSTGSAVVTAVAIVALVNLGLALLNLMPGYPFDASRVLRAFFWYISDDLVAATRLVGIYGYLLCLIALAGGVLLIAVGGVNAVWSAWLLVGAWMINRSISGGANHVFWTEHSKRLRIDDVLTGGGPRVRASETIDDVIEQILERHGEGPILVVEGQQAVGLVDLGSVRGVPRGLWTERTVDDIKRPLDTYPRIDEQSSLHDLVELLPAGSDNIVLIERRGRVVNAVTRDVVNRRLQEYLGAERLEQLRQGRRF